MHYQATVEHCEQLIAIDRQCYLEALTPARLKRWLRSSRRAVVVKLEDNRLQGYALVERTGPGELEVVRLGVSVADRGRGVCRGLIEVIGGSDRLVVWLAEGNRGGLEAARALGFVVERIERDWRGGESGVVLARQIA